jgi:hypothetical protein
MLVTFDLVALEEYNCRQHHGNGRTVSVLGAKIKVQRTSAVRKQ